MWSTRCRSGNRSRPRCGSCTIASICQNTHSLRSPSVVAQTGGSLVETLQNLQDLVRRRVALSKRGKALAAEARYVGDDSGSSAVPRVYRSQLSFKMPATGLCISFYPNRQSPYYGGLWLPIGGHICDAPTDPPEFETVNHDQLLLLSLFGGGILVLIAAAFLLLFQGASEQEIARRIGGLRDGATVAQQRSSRLLPMLGLVHRVGSAMRDRLMSAR